MEHVAVEMDAADRPVAFDVVAVEMALMDSSSVDAFRAVHADEIVVDPSLGTAAVDDDADDFGTDCLAEVSLLALALVPVTFFSLPRTRRRVLRLFFVFCWELPAELPLLVLLESV